jgi:hypothetical protein
MQAIIPDKPRIEDFHLDRLTYIIEFITLEQQLNGLLPNGSRPYLQIYFLIHISHPRW